MAESHGKAATGHRPPSPSLCVNSPSLSEMISMDGQMQMSLGGLIYMGVDVVCRAAVCDWTVVCGNEGGIHQKERMGKWGGKSVQYGKGKEMVIDWRGREGRACVSRTWLFKKNSRRRRGVRVRSFPLFFLSLRHAIHARAQCISPYSSL